ncbi:proto-oncogene tyrosine-protein kinase ROS [Discoglossus pictus]
MALKIEFAGIHDSRKTSNNEVCQLLFLECHIEPTSPFASSIGSHNITLRWMVANNSRAEYIIQWKYVHIPGEWEYTQNVSDPPYIVTYLQPYTEYWFRVVWIICQRQFYSLPSTSYRTLAFGVPAVAPLIENLQSFSGDTIEVSWLPPLFPNGPIVAYYLKLSTDYENQRHYSVTGRLSFQFYATKPETRYRFSVTAVNGQGEGPSAEANITTIGSAGVSINIHTEEVYFSEQNHIWVKGANNMSDASDLRIFYSGPGPITSISVDWLYSRIYFVIDRQVYNCYLNNCSAANEIPLEHTFSPRKIVADPYNGYLFLLMDDGIHRTVLPEFSEQHNVTHHIVDNTTIQDFMINVKSKRLFYVQKLDSGIFSIVSVFLDGSDYHYLRKIQDHSIMEIKSFLYFNNQVFLTDGNIVFYETFITDTYWYNEYLVVCDIAAQPPSGYNNMVLYAESVQPFPLPSEPQQVMMLCGLEHLTVLWKPPKTTLESIPRRPSLPTETQAVAPQEEEPHPPLHVVVEETVNIPEGPGLSQETGTLAARWPHESPPASWACSQPFHPSSPPPQPHMSLSQQPPLPHISWYWRAPSTGPPLPPAPTPQRSSTLGLPNLSYTTEMADTNTIAMADTDPIAMGISGITITNKSGWLFIMCLVALDIFYPPVSELLLPACTAGDLMAQSAIGKHLSGPTSWQDWTYTVNISAQHPKITTVFSNIKFTELTITELNQSAQYEVTVQASSPAGASQWTVPIKGTTLHPAVEDPYFLAVGVDGIWRQPLDKFGPGIFISENPRLVSDMDWYNGTLYWSNETGHVNMWNTKEALDYNVSHIPGVKRVGSLAFDWLGQSIYWSDKANSKIYRRSFITRDIETVTVVTYLVTDLVVDSVNAFIYWCTDYTVESSRLNGHGKLILQELRPLSSTKVVAVTMDIKSGLLYWLVKDGLKINMYNANLRKDGSTDVKFTETNAWSSSDISQHALMFHSDRLFWINGKKYITVQVNQSIFTPFSQPAEFTAFTLALNSLKPLPGEFSSVPKVIPDAIPSASVEIKGNYSSFLIIWSEALNVEYGAVFYCVNINLLPQSTGDSELCLTPKDFNEPFYTVKDLTPYAEFDFAVTPYTYWGRGSTTSLTLRAPEGVPSEPLTLRIFLPCNNSVFDKDIIGVELRWDTPNMPNGALIKFTVSYRIINESHFNGSISTWTTVNTLGSARSFILYDLNPGLVQFQVTASTSVGTGPVSELEKNTSDIHPVPSIIAVSSELVSFIETDRKEALWNLSSVGTLKLVCYTVYDEALYYILNDLLLCRDLKQYSTLLLLQDERLLKGQSITIDWIARHIYITLQENGTKVFVIDLEQKEKSLKLINTLHVTSTIEAISFFSLNSRLYFVVSVNDDNRILYYDIIKDTIKHILGSSDATHTEISSCNCFLEISKLGPLMTLDTTDSKNPGIYFQSNVTDIWGSDLDGCHCWKVITISMLSDSAIVTSLAVDDCFIYWSIKDKDITAIYQANKHNKFPALLQKLKGDAHVIAYSASLQPFPETPCLVLAASIIQPMILSATNTSFTVKLPPAETQKNCSIVNITPIYYIKYRKVLDHDSAVVHGTFDPSKWTTIECQEQIAVISGLQPYSTYEMEIIIENYYSFLLAQKPTGTVITGNTAYGVPDAVHIILVTVMSDSLVNITWSEPLQPNGPLHSIRYQVTATFLPPLPSSPLRKSEFPDGKLAWAFTGLHAETTYHFKVLTFHPNENWFSESSAVYATTFEAPAIPASIVPGNTSLSLTWRAPKEVISRFWFELKETKKSEWFLPMDKTCKKESIYTCMLTGVLPNTHYHVQAVVIFGTGATSVSDSASFKTTAGVPSKPGVPQIVSEDPNSITWEIAEDNGSDLTYNILEYKKEPADGREVSTWHVAYNGSCIYICMWKAKGMEGTFHFRAVAANMLGLGNYSDTSASIVIIKEKANNTKDISIIVATVLALLLVILLTMAFAWHRRSKFKTKTNKETIFIIPEDKELSELRGLSSTVGLTNACYAVGTLPIHIEMEKLPCFPREKLTLCVFLGSGAFGEVYEGTAVDIFGPETGCTNVAVKTLKKDATDHEKAEFLKEAHLMSQFDHPNILKLLGVCLFNEPQYIILELMDGGDLLSYLRGARRNTHLQNPLLSTLDLLDISENISKGCAYLEKMHFVHRDLAARNCLVSVKGYDNPGRTVKIGDFGLARDVYKNDYYRKQGEGLLPVRWMPPESLIDGIFSIRTDVWSFGVLLWEIFTLGQQPYPGYSNVEVIHYVCSGQRIDTPMNCPDDMSDLILKCWAQDPLKRPSFYSLQKTLEHLKCCSLRCTQSKKKRMDLEGFVNSAFEDTEGDDMSTAEHGTSSLTLTEERNAEGLNYLLVIAEHSKNEENN